MISGAHAILYSRNPDADRAFLRDVLGLPHVDVGEGWLIFGLPPAEVAVHPSDSNDVHELYFICEDIEAFAAAMREHGVDSGEVLNRGWGLLVEVSLPGGGRIGVYQPRHARPPAPGPASRRRSAKPPPRARTARSVARRRPSKATPRKSAAKKASAAPKKVRGRNAGKTSAAKTARRR